MSWTLVASARGVDSATLDSTGANVLIASFRGGSLASVVGWDNKGNTWTKLTESIVGTHRHYVCYCISPTSVGASHTIADPNAGVQEADLHFYAFAASGTVAFHSEATANDGTFGGLATNSANRTGSLSVTPPSDDALIFAGVGVLASSGTATSWAVDNGFTLGQSLDSTTEYGGASVYLNQGTAAAIEPVISWTAGGSRWAASAAVFTNTGGETVAGQTLTVTASVISGGASASSGATITAGPLKNNAGTILASTAIAKLAAVKLSDMSVVATWTDQTTDGDGMLTLTDGALVAATDYLLVTSAADGLAVGVRLYAAA